jgi:hypothetical protein
MMSFVLVLDYDDEIEDDSSLQKNPSLEGFERAAGAAPWRSV